MKEYNLKKKVYSRKDITRRASYKLNMSIDEAKVVCDCLFEIIQEILVEDEDNIHLEIRKFGVFDVKKTKQRTNALNPRTKEKIIIPERKRVTFKASKKIKEIIYKKDVN